MPNQTIIEDIRRNLKRNSTCCHEIAATDGTISLPDAFMACGYEPSCK